MHPRLVRSQKIQKNFDSMLAVLESMLKPNSPINSMIVSGAPGIGKTYSLSNRLNKAHSNAECNVTTVSGKMTTLALFEVLYKNRFSTNIIVLDDMDSIFDSEDGMNLLKAVLDTSKRTVSYISSSKYLKDNGIPSTFDFFGKIVFITNKDLTRIAASKSKQAPHCQALISRSVYIDLEIQSKEDIMIHIENVMLSTNILEKYNVNQNGSNMILNWMLKHQERLQSPSLRTPVLISALYNSNPYDWEEICENVYLEK